MAHLVGSQIFYSRRIGRAPQLHAESEFRNSPSHDDLGAASSPGILHRVGIGLLSGDEPEHAPSARRFNRSTVVDEATTPRPAAGIGRLAAAASLARQSSGAPTRLWPATRFRGAYVIGADSYRFLARSRLFGQRIGRGQPVTGSTAAINTAPARARGIPAARCHSSVRRIRRPES